MIEFQFLDKLKNANLLLFKNYFSKKLKMQYD